MPTVADLERLKALTERLTPLGGAAQGELIRAEDWNTLVGAVGELARVVLAEDRQATVPPHEHADQVTVGWLDPRLRALVERGPLSDPAAETRLQALEQRVERLAARIEGLFGSVGEVRDRVTEVTTRDLVRQAEVIEVRRSVEGLGDGRESVRELRTTLGALQRDVATAVTVGQRLTVEGQPIDFNDLFARVARADELRDRLTSPDGSLFDARTLENRLTELTNTLVTQETLDRALENVRPVIDPDVLAGIEGNLRNQLLEQVNVSVGTFGEELRAETNVRFAELDTRTDARIADAVPNITTSVLNTIRPEFAAQLEGASGRLEGLIGERVEVMGSSLVRDYTEQIESLRGNIGERVGAELDVRLADRLQGFTTRLGRLEETVRPMSDRIQRLERDVDVIRGRNDLIRSEIDVADGRLRGELLAEMDRRDQLQAVQFTRQLTELDAQIGQRTTVAIGDSRRTILEEARVAARDTVRLEVGGLESRLRSDFGSISRNAVTEIVRSELSAATPTLTRSISENLRLRR